MKIRIVSSSGTAATELAAFDSALRGAGIANMNLICLSSVIPPESKIVYEKPNIAPGDFGKRLYVVMARKSTTVKNEHVAAGIGWVMEKERRFGLFVEHEGETREEVEKLITKSLLDMTNGRRDYEFSEINYCVKEATCVDSPTCALAVAIYQIDDWTA